MTKKEGLIVALFGITALIVLALVAYFMLTHFPTYSVSQAIT